MQEQNSVSLQVLVVMSIKLYNTVDICDSDAHTVYNTCLQLQLCDV